MIELVRPIRFEEVDAAGIVFFGRYPGLAHEAMESLFGQLPGGYSGLTEARRIGFPAVKLTVEYHRPVRYGEELRIELTVPRIGNRSLDLQYRMFVRARGHHGPGELATSVLHTVVVSDLVAMRSVDMPPEVRALLEAHR